MKLIIDIPEEVKHKLYAYGLSLSPSDKEQLIKAIANGTPIPDNAKNGDLIMVMFPSVDTYFSNVIDMKLWWKAPYQKGGKE